MVNQGSESSESEDLKGLWALFQDDSKSIENTHKPKIKLDKEFPSTMLVSTAFDELFQCFSIGGQVKNYYRYGELSYCKPQREKLWFAIKNGDFFVEKPITERSSPNDIEKAVKIQEFYRNRLMQQKSKQSSEDIWERREQQLVNPFDKSG